MNIVICRNMNGKHAYLFKNFNIGEENVADLVTNIINFCDNILNNGTSLTDADKQYVEEVKNK